MGCDLPLIERRHDMSINVLETNLFSAGVVEELNKFGFNPYHIRSIVAFMDEYEPGKTVKKYRVIVDTPDGFVVEFKEGKPVHVPCDNVSVITWQHWGLKGEWVATIEHKKFSINNTLCAIDQKAYRSQVIDRAKARIKFYNSLSKEHQTPEETKKFNAAQDWLRRATSSEWTPCEFCKSKSNCDKKARVGTWYPDVNLGEGKSAFDTWKLASSVAGIVAKLMDPEYPKAAPIDKSAGFHKCGSCIFANKTVTDAQVIDPVMGIEYYNPESVTVVRSQSTGDLTNDGEQSLWSCLLHNKEVWPNDKACLNDYCRRGSYAPQGAYETVKATHFIRVENGHIIAPYAYVAYAW